MRKRATNTESTTIVTPAPAIRWLFYAFIFSLAFETVGEEIGLIEPPIVLGGLLILSMLFQPALILRWPPKAFWCFIIYAYLFVTFGFLEPARYRAEMAYDTMVLLQLTGLGWIAYNLMRDRRVAENAFIVLIAACAVLSVSQLAGIATGPVETLHPGEMVRATAFGFHPNHLGRILALGIVAIIGLLYARRQNLFKPILISAPFTLVIVAVLIQSGSRGALLALVVALVTFVLRGKTFTRKLINAFALVVLVGLIGLAAWQSEVMHSRFEETIEDGDLARREEIYPTAWEMFTEKPILGWGPITTIYELGMRLGHPEEETKNPHNLILHVIVTSGVVGALPLFIGLGLCTFAAWKTRRGPHGALPLAMTVAVLAINMSGVWLFNKLHWVVMAYALASLDYGAAVTSVVRFRVRHGRSSVEATGYASA